MTITKLTPQQVLDLKLPDNDSGADTVRGYLVALLRTLWQEQDGFSGNRPFGNSDWASDLYVPLIKAGYVRGVLDEDGYIWECDDDAADALITSAIEALA